MDDHDNNVLLGTITRKVVCMLIKHKALTPSSSDDTQPDRTKIAPLINWRTLESVYPAYPDIDELYVSEADRYP